jgi:hypothetical protein
MQWLANPVSCIVRVMFMVSCDTAYCRRAEAGERAVLKACA